MVIQEIFRNVILEEVMCGILRWQLQFIAQKPISFGLFQEEVNDFYLPDSKPVLKRKQSTPSMYLNGIAACCFSFVFFIQSNAQQGILGLEDGWMADFNNWIVKGPRDGRLCNCLRICPHSPPTLVFWKEWKWWPIISPVVLGAWQMLWASLMPGCAPRLSSVFQSFLHTMGASTLLLRASTGFWTCCKHLQGMTWVLEK